MAAVLDRYGEGHVVGPSRADDQETTSTTATTGTAMATEPDELWSPQQLADFCGVTIQVVYKWNATGTGLMYYRLGKHCP
jgi:hypothetical protein